MPYIAPFKGLRYDPKKIGSLAKVVTPPYDVISPKGQAAYYRRHPENFIRVVYGKQYPSDTPQRNRYTRAKQTLQKWIRTGILKYDLEPSLYPHCEEYTLGGKQFQRWGVIAIVRLDSADIYPHEETKGAPKQDRIWLIESVEASLSPIFGLIPDAGGEYRRSVMRAVISRRPSASVRSEGVTHRLWRIGDSSWISKMQAALAKKELVIADGHHRLEAALFHRNKRKGQDPHFHADSPENFAMFYLAAAGDEEPGLLPTHRVLQDLSSDRIKRFLQEASKRSHLQSVEGLESLGARLRSLRAQGRLGIGLYTGNGGGYLLQPAQAVSHQLDVEWLHNEILPQWMGREVAISYTQDLKEAGHRVKRGTAQAVFVMQPPSLKDVLQRARASVRMPGKTTYFYPKPLAGLVEYKF